MGSATGKSKGGGKGSWTERQIGMLPIVTLLCINKLVSLNAYLITKMQLYYGIYIKCK